MILPENKSGFGPKRIIVGYTIQYKGDKYHIHCDLIVNQDNTEAFHGCGDFCHCNTKIDRIIEKTVKDENNGSNSR